MGTMSTTHTPFKRPPRNWLCQAAGGAPLGGSAEGAAGGNHV
jgi:hypothetical protein